MKRFSISLAGAIGLLACVAACDGSPLFPDGSGAPEGAPQYVDVLVRNQGDLPLDVSVAIGQDEREIGVIRQGGSELVRVAPLGMTGGPARFVAIATGDRGTLRTEPLDVMPGWVIEVTFTAMGAAATHRPECDRDGGFCTR